jgi:hypothetical protein
MDFGGRTISQLARSSAEKGRSLPKVRPPPESHSPNGACEKAATSIAQFGEKAMRLKGGATPQFGPYVCSESEGRMFPPLRTNRRGEFHGRKTAGYWVSGLDQPSLEGLFLF